VLIAADVGCAMNYIRDDSIYTCFDLLIYVYVHLVLRWRHFDAAWVLIAAGAGCAMSFIRDDSIYT